MVIRKNKTKKVVMSVIVNSKINNRNDVLTGQSTTSFILFIFE